MAVNKTTSKLPAALIESVNFHEDEMFVGFCDKKVEKNYKFFSEINHDGKNSVLYPLDTLKRREIAFAVNKISPECFENGIYKWAYFCILRWMNPSHRMKIAYSRRNPYDSSNDCGLCSTMVEFNELNTTYPIEVMIKAKNEGSVRKYLVDVNGNAGPACEFIATALCRCLSSTVF